MLEALDARATRFWALATLSALGDARDEIDALNVFPVPDGDTGTNLYLTVEAACAAVQALPADADVRRIAEAFAHGALLGARGNSGIISAQLLRGWADVLAEHEVMDAAAVKEAFARGDAQAWAAVSRPVEGTILSVSRASALAAGAAGDQLGEVAAAATRAAREALARTPEQLEVLRRSGVVDAGGRGLVVILEAFEDVVRGRRTTRRRRALRRPGLPAVDLSECRDVVADGPAYEVMYLLDAAAADIPALRARLDPMGDSLVVVGGQRLWHVHVHVDDPGAAVEAAIATGRPYRIRISHFGEQAARRGDGRPGGGRARVRAAVGVVACAAGTGLADLFTRAGAVVVPGGPGRRPSTAQVLEAVRASAADGVIVLPNDEDTLAVAEAAAQQARAAGLRVSVVPTRAQVHGLAAIAVHDPARGFDDDLVRMSAAAGAARDGAVTVAAREAMTTAGPCHPGDALGVVQGDFVVVGADLAEVAVEVLRRLLSGGGELVTLVRGAEADEALLDRVRSFLHREHRDVEVAVLEGGQARYPLLLGVE